MKESSVKDDPLQKELEQKINIVDSESYDPGPPLTKVDYSLMIIIVCISIIGLIWGGY